MEPQPTISSLKNPLVRRFRDAAQGDPPEVMLVDGIKLVKEALDAELPVIEAAVTSRLLGSEAGKDVRRRLERASPVLHTCSDQVLERIAGVATPQGVSAIVRRPAYQPEQLRGGRALIVVAAGIKDPGNLGAVIRTAEAAGATGVICLAGGADPFRDKALRGASGSTFRLPVIAGVSEAEALALLEGLHVVVAETGGEIDCWKADFGKPGALVIGNEGHGVPDAFRSVAAQRVRIPIAASVESLNVAVAAGVLLFEARRQRG